MFGYATYYATDYPTIEATTEGSTDFDLGSLNSKIYMPEFPDGRYTFGDDIDCFDIVWTINE